MELKKMIIDSRFAYKEIKPNLIDSAEYRWEAKEVLKSKTIYNGNGLKNIILNGIGSLEESIERSHSGKERLLLRTNTDIEDVRPRPFSSIQLNFDKENWSEYNRISFWIYPESIGFQNFYFHFSLFNENEKGVLHAPSLTPNQWNHVTWEIPHIKRDSIIKLNFGPILLGTPPEAEEIIKVFIDDIKIEAVNPDYINGWDLNSRIAFSHSGYYNNQEKVALTGEVKEDNFRIIDASENVVYTNKIEKISSSIGSFYKLDFSTFNTNGEYYIELDDRKTGKFEISELPYKSAIWKSMNFLRMLRCGEDVPEVHSQCHLNHYTLHPDGRMLPDHGGWHDAGDVSQFEICTSEMAHAILDLAEKLMTKDLALSERLLEEARWGVNWLLRTRFNDGNRALAVHYSIWRKNIVKSEEAFSSENPIFKNNIAESGPFENFIAAAAEAVAARIFQDKDKIFADWCLKSAKEDFAFAVEGYKQGIYTKRWGPGADSQVSGAGALAAAELYEITKDVSYLEQADIYAKTVLLCQQSEYPNWEIPLRGFFYEDVDHTKLLTYEHRGHEQSPVHGLTRLCEVAPNYKSVQEWKTGIELYGEYILSTAKLITPYNLLPAHVYEIGKVNIDRITVPSGWASEEEVKESLNDQIKSGIRLNENVYLRRFPIAIQRRGFHATLLSKTKGVSSIAKVLNNQELKQIAINQLEWILGKNPFATSTMYGEGYNYHPLYVAFSRQLVGSLPVGFETLGSNDAPFWPVINNAVYKEIWGHTTGKFLWVLADLV